MMPRCTSSGEARNSAERIRAALGECRWPHRPLTASFGIATCGPNGGGEVPVVADLVEQADVALYHSKQQGRDRITIRDDMPDRASPVPVPVVEASDPSAPCAIPASSGIGPGERLSGIENG